MPLRRRRRVVPREIDRRARSPPSRMANRQYDVRHFLAQRSLAWCETVDTPAFGCPVSVWFVSSLLFVVNSQQMIRHWLSQVTTILYHTKLFHPLHPRRLHLLPADWIESECIQWSYSVTRASSAIFRCLYVTIPACQLQARPGLYVESIQGDWA